MREKPQYEPGETFTERPSPRVLVVGVNDPVFIEALRERVATVGVPDYIGHVDLEEWDCVITRSGYASYEHQDAVDGYYDQPPQPETYSWEQVYPPHISIVYAVRPLNYQGSGIEPLDFWPPEGSGPDIAGIAVVEETGVQGQHVTFVKGLPGRLDDLARRHLAPIAEKRLRHTVFDIRGRDAADDDHPLHLRPLLLGPRSTYLAATYERTDQASVWLLPEDVDDLLPWVLAALEDWHERYPDRFPALPDWPAAEQYRTQAEVALHAELEAKYADIDRLVNEYLAEKAAVEERLKQAAAVAATFERALLTEQGEPLATAVGQALAALGFIVRDMDAEREGQAKKEDFRVTDPDAPAWEAIAEVKGFGKGVRETGLLSLGRWATAYVVETRQEPSARWYIANQFLREDPSTRPAPFETRPDFVETLVETGTLLIDTYALFRLVRAVQDNPVLAKPVCARLRDRVGRLSHADAEALLDDARRSSSGPGDR